MCGNDMSISFLIKQIDEAIIKNFNDELKEHDITASQMHILAYMFRHCNEKVTQKDIERYLGVSHPTVVGLLKRLEAKGFIRTELTTEGRIRKPVYITEKFLELDKKIRLNHDRMEEELYSVLSGEEKNTLKDMLSRIYENVREKIND